MKTVCVVTSTRADYGILTPLLHRIQEDSELVLRLVATGMHLSDSFGHTVDEILAEGFCVHARIPILEAGDTALSMSTAMANALAGFGAYFRDNRPDMLVVLGDRCEMCAVCAAAANARIPIAHLHGGETTEGAVDECFRHSITKMSYLHFTACEAYRKRVIQLGESPERVFNVGALGVENALHTEFLALEGLGHELAFDFLQKPYAVVTFHPVTLEDGTAQGQLQALLAVLSLRTDMNFLITKSNADAGGREINAMLDAFAKNHANCRAEASLGMRRYMSALKNAACVIGNSSSGILEAPSFGIPTVNIGDRQRGRIQAQSVINCAPTRGDILRALEQALSPEFRQLSARVVNPYGAGDTSFRIVEIIQDFLYHKKIDLKKKFFDIPFEVSV